MQVERKTFYFLAAKVTHVMLLKFYFPRIDAKWSFSLSLTYSASTEERPKEVVYSTETNVLLFLFQELILPLFNFTCLQPSVPHIAQ